MSANSLQKFDMANGFIIFVTYDNSAPLSFFWEVEAPNGLIFLEEIVLKEVCSEFAHILLCLIWNLYTTLEKTNY